MMSVLVTSHDPAVKAPRTADANFLGMQNLKNIVIRTWNRARFFFIDAELHVSP
jgi:hypothetical protein